MSRESGTKESAGVELRVQNKDAAHARTCTRAHTLTRMQGSDVLGTVGNFTCPNAISISVGQKT